jgi:hypothetical protein
MSEHSEQCRVINWAWIYQERVPALAMLFAVPNGGLRNKTVAVKLKMEGVKSGVPDLILPVPVKKFTGLAIEMKDGKNKTTENQEIWLKRLASLGWKTAVCYSADEAIKIICEYLGLVIADYT